MMKNAIKREQSPACLSYAEREHFRATLKKQQYIHPAMQVVKIQAMRMLAGSNPDAHEQLGGNGQLAPMYRDIAWDFDDE